MTKPKNITVNPSKQGHGASTVGHLLGKLPTHLPDPYDRRRELDFVSQVIISKSLCEIERKTRKQEKTSRKSFQKHVSWRKRFRKH